jgi:hypothetical protein
MIFNEREKSVITSNKDIVKSILEKKYDDIISQLLLEKDPIRSEVLKLWAKECKELAQAMGNIGNKKETKDINTTGI